MKQKLDLLTLENAHGHLSQIDSVLSPPLNCLCCVNEQGWQISIIQTLTLFLCQTVLGNKYLLKGIYHTNSGFAFNHIISLIKRLKLHYFVSVFPGLCKTTTLLLQIVCYFSFSKELEHIATT